MEAGAGSKPSAIWRSLLWGRSLVEKGLKWRVGNWENIRIYEDKWIPDRNSNLRDFSLLKSVRHLQILDVFLWLMEKLEIHEFEFFAIRTWACWSERNRIIHKHKQDGSGISVDWCVPLLQEFHNARRAVQITPPSSSLSALTHWYAPPPYCLRLDIDATVNYKSNSFAIGGVIRDHQGQLIFAFGRRIEKPPSVVFVELEAIKDGLRLAHIRGFPIYQVSSDSLLAVQAVTSLETDISYNGAKAGEVRNQLSHFQGTKLTHIRRSANLVAHSIASFAISFPVLIVWELENFPTWMVELVSNDAISY
ncbi:uncharacterized protein [Henckelia pumila]|uniref:uncharacterized protein n=1 Tax=Henckelia pumila TaxID=405737 RepID=UPI003C6DF8E2